MKACSENLSSQCFDHITYTPEPLLLLSYQFNSENILLKKYSVQTKSLYAMRFCFSASWPLCILKQFLGTSRISSTMFSGFKSTI